MESGGKAELQGNVSSDYVSHVPLQLLIMQCNLLRQTLIITSLKFINMQYFISKRPLVVISKCPLEHAYLIMFDLQLQGMSYSIVWKIKKAWNIMYQVKISHRHSPLASQPSLSFSLVWHIPKVQTLEQFHRWTWNVVMSIFNALSYNTNTSVTNITLHYSHNTLYLALFLHCRVLFYYTSDNLLISCQISKRRNAKSTGHSVFTQFSETNYAHLLQAQGFALNSRAAGQNQTFALPKPICISRCMHINSPVHDDKTVHKAVRKASAQKYFLASQCKKYQKRFKFCTSFLQKAMALIALWIIPTPPHINATVLLAHLPFHIFMHAKH